MGFHAEVGKSFDGRRTRSGAEAESSVTGVEKSRTSSNNRVHLLSAAGVVWDWGPQWPREKRRKYIWRRGLPR